MKIRGILLATAVLFSSSCGANPPLTEIELFSYTPNLSDKWVLTHKTVSYIEKPYDIELTFVKDHVTLQLSQAKCTDCARLMANIKEGMNQGENVKSKIVSINNKEAVLTESTLDYKNVKVVALQTFTSGLYHKLSMIYPVKISKEAQKQIKDEFELLYQSLKEYTDSVGGACPIEAKIQIKTPSLGGRFH